MWEFTAHHLIGNLTSDDLGIDEAYLNVSSSASKSLFVYSVGDECIKCPMSRFQEMAPGEWKMVKFSTIMSWRWCVFQQDVGPFASDTQAHMARIDHPDVGQFGVYKLDCNDHHCTFTETVQAVDGNISLFYAFLITLFVGLIIFLIKWTIQKYVQRFYTINSKVDRTIPTSLANSNDGSEDNQSLPTVVEVVLTKPTTRLRSLDAFRGLIVTMLVPMTYGGGHYWWMSHAYWNGMWMADVPFPSFLWIMGVCLPLSLKHQLASSLSKMRIIRRMLWRSVKLVFLGLIMNTFYGSSLETFRLMNVLQRFGIAYFVVGTMYVLLMKPTLACPPNSGRFREAFQDIYVLGPQWLFALFAAGLQLAIVYGVTVPGCQRGYVGPGGNHEGGIHRNCTGGVSGYIDRFILGENHLYRSRFNIYDSQPFEPEGLLGCLNTCVHVFLGVQCGMTLLIYSDWKARAKRFMVWAVLCGLLAGILCGFRIEDGPIPINKKLWSLSFVLLTNAMCYAGYTLMFVAIDVQHWWSGNPVRWAGMNSVLVYFGNQATHDWFPFHWRIGRMNTHFMMLLENIWCTAMWLAVAWYLHRKKMYLKV